MQQELNLRLLTEADYESAALTTQPCMLSFANKIRLWLTDLLATANRRFVKPQVMPVLTNLTPSSPTGKGGDRFVGVKLVGERR